jgi:hypothetical protein
MPRERLIYGSPNGDRWYLVRDVGSGRMFVRHEPNVPSGGRSSNISIGEFLVQDGHGPEHQELLRLIGTLVETSDHLQGSERPEATSRSS